MTAPDTARDEIEAVAQDGSLRVQRFGEEDAWEHRVRVVGEVIVALDRVRAGRARPRIPPLCDRCGGDHYITEHDQFARAERAQPPSIEEDAGYWRQKYEEALHLAEPGWVKLADVLAWVDPLHRDRFMAEFGSPGADGRDAGEATDD